MIRSRSVLPAVHGCFLLSGLLLARAAWGEEKEPQPEPGGEEQPTEELKGRGANTEGWEKYLELVEAKYIPAAKEGALPTVQLKFDLAPEIPKGAKIDIEFELNGGPYEEISYILKDENRKGLTVIWKPKKRPPVNEYLLNTYLRLESQTPAVQKIIKANAKRFPAKNEPWKYYYFHQPIQVGTPEDEAKEKEEICALFRSIIEKLMASGNEFKEKMDKVKKGSELVSGATLDAAKLAAFIVEWRSKQGEIQKEIVDFQVNEPGLAAKAGAAVRELQNLGRMVSKRAVQLQKEVTDQYKAEAINPPSHEHFDRAYRYAVNAKTLNSTVEKIERLACPEAAPADDAGKKDAADPATAGTKGEEKPKEGGEAAAGDKSGDDPAATEGAGTPTEEGEEPTKEPEKPKKKKKKTTKPTAK